MGDQGGAVRLAQDVGDIVSAQTRVHGNVDGADLGAREHGMDPLGAVLEPDRDLLARGHTELDQTLGQTIDLGRQLAKRETATLEGQGFAIAPADSGVVYQPSHGSSHGVPIARHPRLLCTMGARRAGKGAAIGR
jgi:hypothetical protein